MTNPNKTTVDEDKNHTKFLLCCTSNTGASEFEKHEHSVFDPYVEKLTSGGSTEIISPFGRINVIAVM